jgi:uracil-DNA glycosylase
MNCISPADDCAYCPRLEAFRVANTIKYPEYHNAPVPSFGNADASRLIVGLAPGLHGANATARPFTGDYAGDTLYEALIKHGLATGLYSKHNADGLTLHDVRITNAVRCVPPENKPITQEIQQCNSFLSQEIAVMPALKTILVLGGIAHKAVLRALGYSQSHVPFVHHQSVTLESGITLLSSYHCSRYNTSTKRLTLTMFDKVIETFAK